MPFRLSVPAGDTARVGLGDVVGRGRDAVILDHGDGLVLRRPLETRMMDVEARVMAWVHEHGYPSPRLVELTTLGLVMERVDGPTMLEDVFTQPRRAQEHMRTLADLHHRLHALPVPSGLGQPFGPGSALLHADLHPGNVLLGPDGPVVIDWTNACAGPAGADVATAWLLMACAGLPKGWRARSAQRLVRRIMVASFLAAADGYGERDLARRALASVLGERRTDPHLEPKELARMQKVVDREGLS